MSPKRLPSGPAAIHFCMSELVFNLFSFLAMVISTSHDILTEYTLKFDTQMHCSWKSLLYLRMFHLTMTIPSLFSQNDNCLRVIFSSMLTLKALIIISAAMILFQYSQCKHICPPVNHFNNSVFFFRLSKAAIITKQNNTGFICWTELVMTCEVQPQLMKSARERSVILPGQLNLLYGPTNTENLEHN